MILAISRFLENWEPEKTPDHPLIQEYWKEISTGANLTFRVDGKFADENPDIIRAWDEYLNQSGSEEKGFCLATGRYDSVARLRRLKAFRELSPAAQRWCHLMLLLTVPMERSRGLTHLSVSMRRSPIPAH